MLLSAFGPLLGGGVLLFEKTLLLLPLSALLLLCLDLLYRPKEEGSFGNQLGINWECAKRINRHRRLGCYKTLTCFSWSRGKNGPIYIGE